MIIATTTEYGVDEDTEYCSRVTRAFADCYLKRPSIEDHAVRTIASMANNDLVMMQAGEESPIMFDAAVAFIDQGRARFLISGRAAAYYFMDGKLIKRSDPAEAAVIGSGIQYQPRLEPPFEIGQGKNAFLTASPCLAASLSDEALERSLSGVDDPEAWMRRLKELVGEEKQFCAIAAFLPMERPSVVRAVLRR